MIDYSELSIPSRQMFALGIYSRISGKKPSFGAGDVR
jgi:hypothetical protein